MFPAPRNTTLTVSRSRSAVGVAAIVIRSIWFGLNGPGFASAARPAVAAPPTPTGDTGGAGVADGRAASVGDSEPAGAAGVAGSAGATEPPGRTASGSPISGRIVPDGGALPARSAMVVVDAAGGVRGSVVVGTLLALTAVPSSADRTSASALAALGAATVDGATVDDIAIGARVDRRWLGSTIEELAGDTGGASAWLTDAQVSTPTSAATAAAAIGARARRGMGGLGLSGVGDHGGWWRPGGHTRPVGRREPCWARPAGRPRRSSLRIRSARSVAA